VVSIAVGGGNLPPVVSLPIPAQSLAEDTAWSFQVPTGTFTDPDSPTLTYSATLAGAVLPGWLSFNAATGTFSGTPPLNFNGAIAGLRVTASDGALSVSNDFNLTVTPVNDAPVVAVPIPTQSVAEDSAWSFRVPIGTFADPDNPTLAYSATLSGAPLPGWLSFDAATGTFAGTPPLNFNGVIAGLRVSASDGQFGVSSDFNLTVTPANDAPIIAGGASAMVDFVTNSTAPAYTPTATDVDSGDAQAWSILAGDDAASFNINPLTGQVSFKTPPSVTLPTDIGADNTYRVRIQVADAGGLAALQVVDIRVTYPLGTILGTAAAETMTGTGGIDTIAALGGNDAVNGGSGNDLFLATINDGNDRYDGGSGTDTYSFELTTAAATASLTLGTASSTQTGSDTLVSIENLTGSSGNDSLEGNSGVNFLRGGDGNDTLIGLAGNDTLIGGLGNDTLNGGSGRDSMVGGAGDDTYLVDSTGDAVVELADEGTDTVQSTIAYTLPVNVENLALLGTGNINGTGNAANNVITGNMGNNVLSGGAGNDRLDGGRGNDTLIGGLGADTLIGGPGNDVFRFNFAAEGGDVIIGYVASEDRIDISAGGFGGGLVAGMNLVALNRYVENTSGLASAALGQFVFQTTTSTLWWDADGTGAGAAMMIANLAGATGWAGSEFMVIA